MRITIDIDANSMNSIHTLTGQKKKSPAIAQALADYIRTQKKRRLIERALAGRTDYSSTNEQLEAGDVYEAR